MKSSLRVTGSLLISSALILAIASPAAAEAPPGEVLTSTGTDCGVLTVTPSTPLYGDEVTLLLTGAQPGEDVSLSAAPGILADNRWFSLLNNDEDSTDGVITTLEPLGDLTADENGTASMTGNVAELLGMDEIPDSDGPPDFFLSLIPFAFVAQCDAGTSYVGMRSARASLTGTIALDPTVDGSVTGSGLPADLELIGLMAPMGDYPDPGVAVWSIITQSGPLAEFSATTDEDGALVSTPFFDPELTLPGRYAVAIVGLDSNMSLVLKAEYVLTVSEDAPATLVLWNSPTPDPEPEPTEVPSAPAAIESTVLNLSLGAQIGELVEGSAVDYSANGLDPESAVTLTLRSTPQVIASGTAAANGRVSGSAVIPAGLETGWHSLTLSGTSAVGSAVESVTWFQIGSDGRLVQVSSTAPALADTGVDTLGALPLAGGLLILGFAAAVLATHRRQTA